MFEQEYKSSIGENQFEIYEAKELFKQNNEIIIRHENQAYRIKMTRNGKLVMNK